jgi:hypothetical protein
MTHVTGTTQGDGRDSWLNRIDRALEDLLDHRSIDAGPRQKRSERGDDQVTADGETSG